MPHKCPACSVNFVSIENGFLYISGEGLISFILRHFPLTILHEDGAYIPFGSEQELESVIDKLAASEEANHVEAALTKIMKKPVLLTLFPELAERIRNQEAVHIIQTTDFQGYFQPIINLQTNELYAYESLLRDPLNRISPGKLFHTAQATGMHSMLDQKARETAIRSRVGKVEDGIKSFINFLPSTIYNPEYCLQHTFQIVEKYDVSPEDLVFEVVETEKIKDIEHLKNIFKVYKREGMKVALDDFGAGFSTMEVLLALTPDYVKVDRASIMFCDQDLEKQRFLKELAAVSRSLGIATLAEGIERKEELEFCRELGMDLAQGYYIGKPGEVPKIPALSGI
ncbi:EAL domain-containing protein [Peribacillus sp. SCS-155]|uniref:EAL domain-containing protein n=1 Tax=Peribacillus sedimenti TaxID=3115297 RepID=UPI003905A0BC